MKEIYRSEPVLYTPPDSRADILYTSATVIAEHLSKQKTKSIVADMDGPVFDGKSLHDPKLITPNIITAFARLESLGVEIGPATARGRHVIDFLRGQGLKIAGAGVIEGGHIFVQGDKTEYIAIPGHTDFIQGLRDALTIHQAHASTWEEVKERAARGDLAFCHGNYQWQGECRSSFWFIHDGSKERAEETAQKFFRPTIEILAGDLGLDPQRDIQTSVTLMYADNLAIFGIKGNILGKPVDKASVLQYFMKSHWVFAADGEGDLSLALVTKEQEGLVVGIKSHLDKSDEVEKFLKKANIVMESPEEFAQILHYTADLLAA